MILYLVRHGQSVGNERMLFFGRTDYPLTGLGRAQARQSAEKLREAAFTRCVASDLRRAWDTALICTEGRGVIPEPCPALREQDMGELEDLTWDQAIASHGPLVERMLADWRHVTPPGGESPSHVRQRVSVCAEELIRRGEDTLVVGHNGSLSALCLYFGLMPEEQLGHGDWLIRHGTCTAIEVIGGQARMLCFNR